jgi:hypothetical protein
MQAADPQAPAANAAARPDWKAIAGIVAAVAGTGGYVSALGTAIVWARMNNIGIAADTSAALVPTDLRLVLGVRWTLLPAVVALAAFLLLVIRREHGDTPEGGNRRGHLPRGFGWVVGIFVLAGLAATIVSEVSVLGRVVMLAITGAFALLTYLWVQKAEGFAQAGVIIFVTMALGSGGLAFTYELTHPPRLDLAVVVRTDGIALGGYYFAKANDAVYLVTAGQPGGLRPAGRTGALPHVAEKRCDEKTKFPLARVGSWNRGCYVVQLTSTPADKVDSLMIGPAQQQVRPAGFSAARRLAATALHNGNVERLSKPPAARKPQG